VSVVVGCTMLYYAFFWKVGIEIMMLCVN